MLVLRAAVLSLLMALPVVAQDAAPPLSAVTLTAPGIDAVTMTSERLSTMPMLNQQISFQSSHGPETARYRGVLLWDLLSAATGIEDDVKPALRQTLLVSARDGHQVAFSVGEIAPDFGNSPVMLAVERDGQPLDAGMRVVVPGDSRGARNIRGVVSIELR